MTGITILLGLKDDLEALVSMCVHVDLYLWKGVLSSNVANDAVKGHSGFVHIALAT